jgi:hypothetical protein
LDRRKARAKDGADPAIGNVGGKSSAADHACREDERRRAIWSNFLDGGTAPAVVFR